MAFLLSVMGWIGETVIKNLIDKVWEVRQGGEGGECGVTALRDLNISLCNIRPIITETENMWIKDRDLRKNVNELLVELKDAAYDAEDLLDKFEFQKLQQQIKQQGNEASDASSSSSSLSFLGHPVKKRKVVEYNDHDDVAEIRKIREKLDNIRVSMDKLLSTDTRGKVQMINEINRVTSSIPIETQVFGRDNELNELIRLLLEPDRGGSRSSNISILTITGLGGVGKTTLAQEAYNDQRVEEYFELRMWVCVSEDFSVERLTKEIIESATKQNYALPSNFDALQVVLKEKTTSKKFLLVLDDVWNEDRRMWDTLCAPLRSGAIGSIILVTTRDEKIANMVGSMNSIHLNGLDDDSSWALFKKCAFGSQNSRDHPQLEAIAKEMVPMLKGLPLAARTLGGLLNRKMNEQHWRTIMHSEVWKLGENRVLLVLQLSYQYLPAHLKRCFAFCSLYPKDYEFDEHELVRIWMAEGFFPAQENITMEDFGSDSFQELVSRSFFQKSQHPDRYVMHDLIHDLAELISGEETYRLEDDKPFEIPTMLRHLYMQSTTVDNKLSRMESHDFNKLRTLIYQTHYTPMNVVLLCGFFNILQSIRTLILRHCGLRELPETIGDFIHLCYLDVSRNFLGKLPNSLCKLYNLQALILKSCCLNELPDSIGNLFYLRYLDISYNGDLNKLPESLCHLSNLQTLALNHCYRLRSLPQGISRLMNLRKLYAWHPIEITEVGKLTSLQRLSLFKVGKEHGPKLAELSGLTQLHGTLTITNLENVESKEEAIAAKLHSKEHIDLLALEWTVFSDTVEEEVLEHLLPNCDTEQEILEHLQSNSTTDQDNDAFFVSEEVLEHLQPNPTVKILKITGYNGARCPSWLEEQSLSKLETLHLVDCKRWDDLSFIRFPCLSVLEIHECPLLNRLLLLPPSLTMLIIDKVGLIEFPGIQEGMGGSSSNIVSPLVVRICGCPNLISLDGIECFPCLKSLDIKDCPLLTRLPPLPPSLVEVKLFQVGLTELSGVGGSSSNIAIIYLLKMQIHGCPNLTSLNQIDCFPCLKSLDIEDCPLLTRLPPLPPSLVKLQLIKVGLIELPVIGANSSNIAIISSLEMQIRGCSNLTSMDRIDCFPCLKSLDIEDCPLFTRLPPLPLSLVELKLINVGLTELPGIGGSSTNIAIISPLEMQIHGCPNLTSLDKIDCFPCLKSLDIEDCPLFTRLPPLPPSLVELKLINVGLTELPGIGGSSSNIAIISPLEMQIRGCPNLTSLDKIDCFPCLKSLDIEDCPLLTRLPPLPPSLVKLRLIEVGLTELPGIGRNSSNIAIIYPLEMQIRGCSNLTSLDRIDCFPCLKSLDIEDCPLFTRLSLLPPSLVELKLINVGLTELPGIGGSSSNIAIISPLEMQIHRCPNLTSLDKIECFPYLKSLDIEDCPLFTRLPPLPPSLVELKLINVGLTELPEIGGSSSNITPVSLSRLAIKKCSSMISLEQGLLSCNLPKLATIFFENCGELQRMPVNKFKQFTYLNSLSIVNCPKLMSMAQDEDIHLLLPPSIQTLNLSNCGKVDRSLSGCLHNLTTLTKLELCDCSHFVSLSREALLHLEGLKSLCLLNCKELRSIAGLGVLKSLKKLRIHGCPRLQLNEGDGQGESICSLVKLFVDNTALLRVSPLRNMLPSIKTLEIKYSLEPNIFEGEDQELLRSLTSLRYLQFCYCKNLQSLPAELHTLSSLECLEVFGCTQIRSLPEKGLPISLVHIQLETHHPSLRKQLDEHWMEMRKYYRLANLNHGSS